MQQEIVMKLLAWYEAHGRDLPWRHTRDPYAIWLSEIILQQTRVAQGMDYWKRFMQTYPTVDDLAAASEDEVLRLWQGLGYYSRARNLHMAAAQIVAMGHFPNTLKEIKSLKGVGDYTAAAIGAFAFGLPTVAVDGNAYRVFARVYGISTPIDSTTGKKEFALMAKEIEQLPIDFAKFNSALMDFGATLCTPQAPQCEACPLMEDCVALREHRVDSLPVKQHKTKTRERHLSYYYIRFKGLTAIHRRGAGDIWQGLWEPFLTTTEDKPFGNAIKLLSNVKHVLTHQVIYADFYLLVADRKPALPNGYIWIPEEDISHYAVPRLIEILLKALPETAKVGKKHR